MSEVWAEVGDRVFVRRYPFFDQNIGLVVGEGACAVVDTRSTLRQARELQDEIRLVTRDPWTVFNTHHHFDHTFGNAAFLPGVIWGHERCAAAVLRWGEEARRRAAREIPELAEDLAEVPIVPPALTMADAAQLQVGGRTIELRHLGRGHTDNDIVVLVPDAGVLFAGDLVEEGAPPFFGDAFPLDWGDTDARLLALATGPVVPGHGTVVGRAFVDRQGGEIAAAAAVATRAHRAGLPAEAARVEIAFPEASAADLARRAYAQLDGKI